MQTHNTIEWVQLARGVSATQFESNHLTPSVSTLLCWLRSVNSIQSVEHDSGIYAENKALKTCELHPGSERGSDLHKIQLPRDQLVQVQLFMKSIFMQLTTIRSTVTKTTEASVQHPVRCLITPRYSFKVTKLNWSCICFSFMRHLCGWDVAPVSCSCGSWPWWLPPLWIYWMLGWGIEAYWWLYSLIPSIWLLGFGCCWFPLFWWNNRQVHPLYGCYGLIWAL